MSVGSRREGVAATAPLDLAPDAPERPRSVHPAYRADLDGLRAIAVLSVVLYHLNEAWIPGGFLGVDLFFVLSGFFITGIIAGEMDAGSFTFARFYERRVRRILPALLTMLAVVLVVAVFRLLPVDFSGLAGSALATIGFAANIFFWRDTNYFTRAAHDKPLLHMWSLGVEEQFYIVMPVLLLLLFRRFRRATTGSVAAIVLLSFVIDVALLRRGMASTEFYLLPSRAWELGVGALLGLARAPHRTHGGRLADGGGAVGVGLLALGFAAPTLPLLAGLPAPLPAVAAAALLVRTGEGGRTVVARLLGWRPLVAIGLVSYSLYLWHWPIIVYMQYVRLRGLTGAEAAGAFALMCLCAWISWRFVEKPFRSRAMSRGRVYGLCAAGAALVAAGACAVLATNGIGGRFPARADAIASAANTHFRCPLVESLTVDGARACSLGLPGRDPARADLVLLGNSHALMYAPVVRGLLQRQGRAGIVLFAYSCPPVTGVHIPRCAGQADAAIAAAVRSPAPVVVVATSWSASSFERADGTPFVGTPEQAMIVGIDGTIDRLRRAGKRVVLVGPLREPLWDVPSEVSRRMAFGLPARKLYASRADFERRFAPVFDHFAARRDIVFIRVDDVQCRAGRCDYVRGNLSLFSDMTHLSNQSLPLFRPRFEAVIGPIVAGSRRSPG